MTRATSQAMDIGGPNGLDDMPGSPPCDHSFITVSEIENHIKEQNETHDDAETSTPNLEPPPPIPVLAGETVQETAEFIGCRLVQTNYRLCMFSTTETSVAIIPLMNIECLDLKDLVNISLACKDGRVYRITAPSYEVAMKWHCKLLVCSKRAKTDDAFAWTFAEASKNIKYSWLADEEGIDADLCQSEWDRLEYDPDHFMISDANKNFEMVETYPRRLILLKNMPDEEIRTAADFRMLKRFPVVVYKSKETNAVMLRSSQPRTGILSWRNSYDEKYLRLINEYMAAYHDDRKPQTVIMDARSYAAAFANRAKGGGYEVTDYYPGTETIFLGLPNIHHVRYAFVQLRNLLSTPGGVDPSTYFHNLQNTNWLQYVRALLVSAVQCVDALQNGSSVLVHCSDGWDRTSQITSLVKLMIDDHYRSIKGFRELITREWIEFGHKFSDRNGVSGNDSHERSPIFLQWLDAVYQLIRLNETAFEFNQNFLLKLGQHSYAGIFGTFLFNSMRDSSLMEKESISLWRFLGPHNEDIVNHLYKPQKEPLDLDFRIERIDVWKTCYQAKDEFCVQPENSFVANSNRKDFVCSPSKEVVSIPKSKSSESISSSDQTPIACVNNGLHESSMFNGIADHAPDSNIMSDSAIAVRQGLRHRSQREKDPNKLKDSVDHDGLVRFFDKCQQRVGEKDKEHKAKIEEMALECEAKDQKIEEQAARCKELETAMENADIRPAADWTTRQRCASERAACDTKRNSCGRVYSTSEDSEIGSMAHAISDLSIIDHVDAPPCQANGWFMETCCTLCRKDFSKFSPSRPHHCRRCGRTVCSDCSPYNYHRVQDGEGSNQRACRDCYMELVKATGFEDTGFTTLCESSIVADDVSKTSCDSPASISSAEGNGSLIMNDNDNIMSESSSSSGEPRSRSDTILTNGTFRNGIVTTQAVKG